MNWKKLMPWNLIPNEIKLYSNEEEGIFAFEIDQPESPFAPAKFSYFHDSKKGIVKYHEIKEKKNLERVSRKQDRFIEFKE